MCNKLMYMWMLLFSTILIISSDNLLSMWMGLEINMISFIPILHKTKNSTTSESCMIYFLTQSMGSILFIMMILINSMIMVFPAMINEINMIIMLISMSIKLGIPPFHFWFPIILEKMNWTECFILMSWQKIGPLFILSIMITSPYMFNYLIWLSIITGSISGLNETSVRKIMAYSSINHMGWMIACMNFNNKVWLIYLLIYSMIMLIMTMLFNNNSIYFMNQLNSNMITFTEKLMISISFLSLSGMPPFIGFFQKWIVIQNMMLNNSYFTIMIMIMMSLITSFFYLRLINSFLLIHSSFIKWNLIKKNSVITYIIIMINLCLPII
nr:NADH dehydrogenase subunit 2 [Ptilocnemus lemur]